jgi:4-diphosphocytidyl-2C-methyl-D-erythritol kinase
MEHVAGRRVHVSGSGSTLFVLCDGRLEADLLAEQIRLRAALPAVAASARGH